MGWVKQKTNQGHSPWVAELENGELKLFVQPWYGDGVNYKGVIKTPEWTVTLHERFKTLKRAKLKTMEWCWKYLKYVPKREIEDED